MNVLKISFFRFLFNCDCEVLLESSGSNLLFSVETFKGDWIISLLLVVVALLKTESWDSFNFNRLESVVDARKLLLDWSLAVISSFELTNSLLLVKSLFEVGSAIILEWDSSIEISLSLSPIVTIA